MAEQAQKNSPVKKSPPLVFDDDKNTPLHFAAARGNESEVLKLIQNEHKIDPENFMGWTPLMMAARNGHMDVVKILLNHRADATRKNKYGMSVFLVSIASNNREIVKELLQHLLYGGVSRQSMETLASPISIAILFNCTEIFYYLLEQFFNINVASPITGLTPIMFAATDPMKEFFNILVSKGADQQAKNSLNQSAFDILHTKPNIIFPQQQYNPIVPQVMPHSVPQLVVYSSQPTMFTYPPNPPPHYSRKSSDTLSPQIIFPPPVSPITPVSYFPAPFITHHDFHTPHYISPQPVTPIFNNDFLNIPINQHQHFFPAMPVNYSGYPSPMHQHMPMNWNYTTPTTPV